MGVDYYNCEICEEIFADAGYYGYCANCEAMLCGHCYDEMVQKNGEIGEDHERASWYGEDAASRCDVCDGTVIDESEFTEFLIGKVGGTRTELEEEFRRKKAVK